MARPRKRSGSTRTPAHGTPAAAPATGALAGAAARGGSTGAATGATGTIGREATLRAALGDRFELVAFLGPLEAGGSAYLVRNRDDGSLAVGRFLKRKQGDTGGAPIVALQRELDASIPGPSFVCAICGAGIDGWMRQCRRCGAPMAQIDGADFDSYLRALAGDLYDILGTIGVRGGGRVAFADRCADGCIVALELQEAPAGTSGDEWRLLESAEMASPLSDPSRATGEYQSPAAAASAPTVVAPVMGRTAPEPPPVAPEPPAADLPIGEMPTRIIYLEGSRGDAPSPAPSPEGTAPAPRSGQTPAGDGIVLPKFCPTCGTEYETDARFCPKDGTALHPRGGNDPLVGRTLAERYHVLRRIGEGGMGRVYLAEHVRMGRQCALKVMRAALLNDSDAAARFGREASNAARILHPHVATVFDYGESEGLIYLVMEYVDGESLSTLIGRERRLPADRVIDLTKQVAEALVAAHELGIVHRDLKPDNILLARRGERDVAKVVDFGIAKAISEAPHESLTRSGLVIGTPEFMSPEQLLGDPVDARSDIYSLGCIVYLALTGSHAAEAPTREAMLKRRLNEPPPAPSAAVPGLPPELDAIVTRMLASSPAERFPSAAALRQALEELRPGTGLTTEYATVAAPARAAPPLVFQTPPATKARRGRRALVLSLVGVGAVIGAAALALREEPSDLGRVGVPQALPTTGASAAVRPPAPTATGGSTAVVAQPAGTAPAATPGTPPGTGATRPQPTGTTPPRGGQPTPGTTASTPPVAPPVSRVPPEQQPVVDAVRRYASAIESGEIEQLARANEGLTRQERQAFERLFRDAEDIRATVRDPKVDMSSSSALVSFILELRYRNRETKDRVTVPATARVATLGRADGRWVVRKVE
jgi:serine/threonine-protein kinase